MLNITKKHKYDLINLIKRTMRLYVSGMWEDYITKGSYGSYELYRQIFASENIGFGEPSQDECDTCFKIKKTPFQR